MHTVPPVTIVQSPQSESRSHCKRSRSFLMKSREINICTVVESSKISHHNSPFFRALLPFSSLYSGNSFLHSLRSMRSNSLRHFLKYKLVNCQQWFNRFGNLTQLPRQLVLLSFVVLVLVI